MNIQFYYKHSSFYITIILLFQIIQSVWLSSNDLPISASDDIFFKQPAIQLATIGRLNAPALQGFEEGVEDYFFLYPPFYMYIYAAWYSAVGFSNISSNVLSFILNSLTSLCLFCIVRQVFEDKSFVFPTMAALLWSTKILGIKERPDELAILLGLLAILSLLASLPSSFRLLSGGIFLGLCGATSPAAGFLYGISCVFLLIICSKNTLSQFRNIIFAVIMLGMVAFATACLVLLPTLISQPGLAVQQFSGAVAKVRTSSNPLYANLLSIIRHMLSLSGMPWDVGLYTLGLFAAAFNSLRSKSSGRAKYVEQFRWIFLSILIGTCFVVVFFSRQYSYIRMMLPLAIVSSFYAANLVYIQTNYRKFVRSFKVLWRGIP